MEHTAVKYSGDLEDGELIDSDEDYTPLKRPEVKMPEQSSAAAMKPIKMNDTFEDIEDSPSDFSASTDSSSDSDDVIKAVSSGIESKKTKKKNKKRTILLRDKPSDTSKDKQARFKKYNIWTASLQDESLSENMREIGVNKYRNDRNVENYDFPLKYQLQNRTSGLKRRTPADNDELSDNTYQSKRSKLSCSGDKKCNKKKLRRRESTSSCDSQNAPRYIVDLGVSLDDDNAEIARDIANKLFEENDAIMIQAVEVLGKEMSIEIFKETQRIERDGGMMVMNGKRRRTPGGVFLFLIKHHDKISPEDKKLIFHNEMKAPNKQYKRKMSKQRNKIVEELKKQLSLKGKELPALSKLSNTAVTCHLKPDSHTNLSNPPPSPVTNAGLESSPDYSSHAINHVSDASPEKQTTRNVDDENLVTYDDDILEMNASDMELF